MKKYLYAIVTALMLSTSLEAQILKGTLRLGDQDVAAEFLKLSDNTVAVGNGRNACISQLIGSGMLTIPGEVRIDGTTYKVTTISRFAFRLCGQLTSVNILENVTKIEEFAFIGCPDITEITLPASLTTLGSCAFASCYDALKTVTCLGETPAKWESNDVFRRNKSSDALMYGYDKQLLVAHSENYSHADGWRYFPSITFGQGAFYVYDATDLTLLRDRSNISYAEKAPLTKVVLVNDIDMSGVEWSQGIGLSEEEPFVAQFDGQGHTISNLTVKGEGSAGFIAHYGGRLIENVTFKNCTVESTSNEGPAAAVVVGETGNMQMSKVWVENCTVDARGPVGGLIGNGLSPSVEINDCVVKDITLNVRYLGQQKYYAAPLVGHVVGGRAWRCAVIGKYNTNMDTPSTNFFINGVSCPFVGKCEASGEFYVYDSYVTHGRFAKNTGPYNPYVKYDKDVAICGKTIDIINANGEAAQLTLTPDDMKSLVMAGVLGRLWIYADGRYPMSYAYADEENLFPVEINKATYVFTRTNASDDMPVNRLFSRTAMPEDFLNLSASGYRSKEYIASRIWMDDNFKASSASLPIGTATIYSEGGVSYDRELSAPICGSVVETAQMIDVDKDGDPAITSYGFVHMDDEVVTNEEDVYEPTGYSVCLPYSLVLNSASRVFYPVSVQEKNGMLAITMTEGNSIEAWKPCVVVVDQDAVPLGTDASVTFMPKAESSDVSMNGGQYVMAGSLQKTAQGEQLLYTLQDDELWRCDQQGVPAFRAYITAANGKTDDVFTTGMGYRAELVDGTLVFRKGLPVTDETLQWWWLNKTEFPDWTSVAKQVVGAHFDVTFGLARPTTTKAWFYNCENLTDLTGMEYLNTSEVINMKSMFDGCKNLETIDLSHFNTKKVTGTDNMFNDCSKLKTVIIGKDWDMSQVIYSVDMFKNCELIEGQYGYEYHQDFIEKEAANAGQQGYLWKLYPYYVATRSGDGTLTFHGSDTAPDDSNTFDASDTGNKAPDWYYYSNIHKAVIDPSFSLARPKSLDHWFARQNNGLQAIEGLEYLNTSRATSMRGMFANCQLETIDVDPFKTHWVTDMSEMFLNCTNLTSLDITNFNTASVTTMKDMFAGCEKLATLDVSNFKTFNVETMSGMFSKCFALTEIDLNNFNIDKLTDITVMFMRCDNLRTIWCDNSWGGVSKSTNMFALCEKLEGAVKYKESETTLDGRMANPVSGYFTVAPVLTLKDNEDNSEVLAQYNGKTMNVSYDRVLAAKQLSNGTWKSVAYTVCLPYRLDLYDQVLSGQVAVYRLIAVENDKEFIFTNDFPFLSSGFAYLVVVNHGSISLDAKRVTIDTKLVGDDYTQVYSSFDDWLRGDGPIAGRWKGTFSRIENQGLIDQHAYILQSDGRFRRVSNLSETYSKVYLAPFRACFARSAYSERHEYSTKFIETTQGEDIGYITDFPADLYHSDGDMPAYDETGILHTIDNDGTHRYFDLQGRQLDGKPGKGIYIDNFKKYISK